MDNKNETVEERTNYIYLGPTLPMGLLKHGTLIFGTRAEAEESVKGAVEFSPQVSALIVETGKLEAAKRRLSQPGALKAAYKQVETAIKAGQDKGGNQ